MNILLSIISLSYLHIVQSIFCYWNTGCPYHFFASKTPYSMVRGDIRDSLVKLTDCEPISIWALIQHGTRNPDSHVSRGMKEAVIIRESIISAHESGKSTICSQDVDNLRAWKVDKEMFQEKNQLYQEGYEESLQIGRRIKCAFSKLLTKLDKEHYTFRSVNDKCVSESIQGFVQGLDHKNLTIDPPIDGYDNLAPFESCALYRTEIDKNHSTHFEAENYLLNSEFLATKDRMQRRLGISHSLTSDNITGMYNLCRLTSSGIQNKFSPWCALFTTEDLKVMEFQEDLFRFYNNSYGSAMNELFGQITISELLKSFRDARTSGKKITAYFTHSTMMDMVYTALGLFKDSYLLKGAERKPNRKWRTSKGSVFSSNLIAVLHRCVKEKNEDDNIVFYLNEEPLTTVCKGGICTWKEFEDKLSPFLNTNIDFCK